jgi:carboxypeptidase family protein
VPQGTLRSLFGRAMLLAVLAQWGQRGTELLAQTNTAEIQGVIRDSTGGLLPGASIVVVSATSGLRIERASDDSGRFFVPGLPVGEYSVTVRLDGFKTVTRPNVIVQVGQRVELPITLPLGERTENVTVSGAVPLLQTANAEISDVIDNRRVQELPLNGRQFLQLAQLSDGVVVPPGGTRGAALEQAGPLPAVLGQRSGHNIYLLDGVKVTDEYFNNSGRQPVGRRDPGIQDSENAVSG